MTSILTPQKGDWDRFWSRDQSEKFSQVSWSKRRIIRLLNSYIVESGQALDAGCGSGFFSKFFCDQGMKVVSLDYSDSALAMAQDVTQGQTTIVKADLLNDPLATKVDDSFDLIFSDGLLEHFSSDDQDRILNNLISVLSKDGVIVTVVPNRWSPWELIRPWYMPGIEEDPFVIGELLKLNERNGLTVTALGGLNTFPFAVSPEGFVAKYFGMLLYTIAKTKA